MNIYEVLAVTILTERIRRNNKILEGTSEPSIRRYLEDEIDACRYAIDKVLGSTKDEELKDADTN